MSRCRYTAYWNGVHRARVACWQPVTRERDTQRARRKSITDR